MSGGFILTLLRQEFSKRCLIVRGFPPGTDPRFVNSIFQGQCRRIQHKEGTTWLILFHNPQQASHFSYPGNIIGIFPLQISPSTVSDIPDNWLQDQEDQGSVTAVSPPGNPLLEHPKYLFYPRQGYQGNTIISPPASSQGQYPQSSENNPYFHGHGKQFHPSAGTPSNIPLDDGPQMVPSDPISYKSSLEHTFHMNYPNASMPGPQMVPFDQTSNTSSFQPTIYENFPTVSMTRPHVVTSDSISYKSSFKSTVNENFPSMFMPVSSVPSPYENHDYPPQIPPRISIRKSPVFRTKARIGAVQSSSIESVYRSSDDADSMRQTRQDFPMEVNVGGRSSSEESINKSSDFVPMNQIVQETTSEVTCSIEVSSLPPNITEEFITYFFEHSKRSGGGDVESVAYDEKNNTAIVTFQDPAGYFQYFDLNSDTVVIN